MKYLITILKDRSFRIAVLVTMAYMGIGVAILQLGLTDYGWVIFVLLPISLGVAIGSMSITRWLSLGVVIGFLLFIGFMIAGEMAGFICILFMSPLVILLIGLGILINKVLVQQGIMKERNYWSSFLIPLIMISGAIPLEMKFGFQESEVLEVVTKRTFNYSPQDVYNTIKSVDTLIADLPFLMKLDLPIPRKCILHEEKVGGIRTCYFDGGTITERITALEPSKVLRMDVINFTLVGREWLTFKEAIYYFDLTGLNDCTLTRITTYTSTLRPRIYWEPLEKMGIRQEHQYVFDNLENDLKQISSFNTH